MKKAYNFFVLLLFCTPFFGYGQQTALSTTDADCPSNGMVIFHVDTCTNFSWIVTDAPNSTYVNLTGNDTFINSLEPGEYIIDFYCDLEFDFTDTFTIGDDYVNMSQTVSTLGLCTNFQEGATISTAVSGGTAPFPRVRPRWWRRGP